MIQVFFPGMDKGHYDLSHMKILRRDLDIRIDQAEKEANREFEKKYKRKLFKKTSRMIKDSITTFFETVKEMRSEQKAFFETKKYEHLDKAKKLEKSIDKQLTEVEPLIDLIKE